MGAFGCHSSLATECILCSPAYPLPFRLSMDETDVSALGRQAVPKCDVVSSAAKVTPDLLFDVAPAMSNGEEHDRGGSVYPKFFGAVSKAEDLHYISRK